MAGDKICSEAWYMCDRCKHGKMDMNHETFLPNGEPSQVWCELSMWAKKRGTTINCKHFIANNLQTTCKQLANNLQTKRRQNVNYVNET